MEESKEENKNDIVEEDSLEESRDWAEEMEEAKRNNKLLPRDIEEEEPVKKSKDMDIKAADHKDLCSESEEELRKRLLVAGFEQQTNLWIKCLSNVIE